MARNTERGEEFSSRETVSATDPASTMEASNPQDREAPRVRFSQDVRRATESASVSQRAGTPSLTIDTGKLTSKNSAEITGPVAAISARKPLGPISPLSPTSATSPRTRERGYSLRRSLFARSLHNQSEAAQIGVEEAHSSRNKTHNGPEGQAKHIGDIVLPGVENKIGSPTALDLYPMGVNIMKQEKKKVAILSNYDTWVTEAFRNLPALQKANMLSKTICQKVFGPAEIPLSKNGRCIELDASRTTPFIDDRTGKEYIWNTIRSSRYTMWNFVPHQLFFQFSKLANAYFLLVSVLQMIPGLSTTGNYTTIAPLLVFVTISMGKEGYDDVRRYRLDQVENSRETLVLCTKPSQRKMGRLESREKSLLAGEDEDLENGMPLVRPKHWVSTKWSNIKVGDIVKLGRDHPVPADVVLLYADGLNGTAFIETMALDGETNLKSKQAPTSLAKRCGSLDEIVACRAQIVVEDPNIDLYNFDGRVTVDSETLPLTTNEIVLRGSTLRNTQTAIGMVINTGEECKIRMNANKNPRIKAPELQKITNKIVVILVLFVCLLALSCTIAYQVWSASAEDRAFYLQGAHVNIAQIFIGFFILFNTLIPLSLYVSLEIIKVGQMLLMDDVEMYDPVSNTPMICNTTTILENLGQVNYIFSDKTGTLTENVMRFRKLSIAGYAWLHDFDLQKDATILEQGREAAENHSKGKGKSDARKMSRRSGKYQSGLDDRNNYSEVSSSSAIKTGSLRRSGSIWRSTARPFKAQIQPEYRTEELLKFMRYKPHSVFTKKARFFLLSLALCHTCLPEVKENGEIEFQAASPDELALVQAAQDLGWLVIDRATRSITLSYPASDRLEQNTETYEVLDVIEFSSKRKRMSIIVRFPSGKICIFCKGADSIIMPRLKHAAMAVEKKTEVFRRSSKRKSMEVEQAIRRMSEHSPRTSFSRTSMSLSRPSINRRRSTGQGRPSMNNTRLQPIRDELENWLRQRERVDVEVATDDIGTSVHESPRVSIHRSSFTSLERMSSVDENDLDEFVDEALVLDESKVFERCFQHIDDFASEGLRTLLFGYRFIDDQEYAGWNKIYLDATTSLVDRQELIEKAGEMIEQNLELVGATAIEDKLQKGVPETIDKLRRANIKIWMLTGDKRETAINIAHSARICKNYSEVVILDHTTGMVERTMATTLLDISKGALAHTVIVVDGQTLSEIDTSETMARLFFDLVVLADSVICCRASPSQKASLVKRVRTRVAKSTTLAVGDGANDIAMILEAHVGIGISGKEGLQAARISDYSIAQFRFLQRLLLVHGRWNYIRTGKYILSTFWKELLFYLLQALYQKWTGYTGTSLFESTSLTVFNTLFTSLAVIIIGVFEQDLDAVTLLAVPELYAQGQRNEGFNIKKYLGWMIMAICESLVIYFTMFGLFGEVVFTHDDNLLSMGTLCFTVSIIFINTKLLILEMYNKTLIPLVSFIITVAGWFAWQILLSLVFKPGKMHPLYPIRNGFLQYFGANPLWWLVVFLSLGCVIVLELGVSSITKAFWPTDTDLFQELQRDPLIRKRFEDTVKADETGCVGEVEMGRDISGEPTNSTEKQREGEIQDLLDRPRVMHSDGGGAEILRKAGALVTQRNPIDKVADDDGIELRVRGDQTRHSVDVAELMRGR